MSYINKVVLITGAASGIGAAIAESFSKLNANICVIDINEKGLYAVKDKCNNLTDGKVISVVADVSKDDDIEKAVETALKELGKIDVLINAAGILGAGGLQDSDIIEKFDKIIAVNLRGVVAMTRKALPALIENKGCVINISSVASTVISENTLVYSIAKAGVTKFTKAAAFELAKLGVRVNCISPGPVRTNILINAGLSEDENDRFWDGLAEKMPMKCCVKAEDIAEMAVYLASVKASSITGSDFVVDAGMVLGAVGDAAFSAPAETVNEKKPETKQ